QLKREGLRVSGSIFDPNAVIARFWENAIKDSAPRTTVSLLRAREKHVTCRIEIAIRVDSDPAFLAGVPGKAILHRRVGGPKLSSNGDRECTGSRPYLADIFPLRSERRPRSQEECNQYWQTGNIHQISIVGGKISRSSRSLFRSKAGLVSSQSNPPPP